MHLGSESSFAVASYTHHILLGPLGCHLGVRPVDYLNRRRVEQAQVLLATTTWPIKKIATETGFGSTAYLCRVFRKHSGQTPSDYQAKGGAIV